MCYTAYQQIPPRYRVMIYPRNEGKRPDLIAAFFTEMSGNTAATPCETEDSESFVVSPLEKSKRIREDFIRRYVRKFFHMRFGSTFVPDPYREIYSFRRVHTYYHTRCRIDGCNRRVSSALVRKTRGRCLTDDAGYFKNAPFCVQHVPSCFYKLDCEYTEECYVCRNLCCETCTKGCDCSDF
jgi:hypothetical protein